MARISPKQASLFDITITIYKRFKPVTYDTLTVGRALSILEAAKASGLNGISKINPAFTREQAYNILCSGLIDQPFDKPLSHLHAKNIVYEFGNDYLKSKGAKHGNTHNAKAK